MSHNTSHSDEAEAPTLISVEDLAETCPECGMTASEHAAFPSLRLLCSQTPGKIFLAHWDRVMRREIAKELEQLAQDEAEDMLSEADYGPDATVYRAVTVASILERAEAIRNG